MLDELNNAFCAYKVCQINDKNIDDVYKLCSYNDFYYECLQEQVSMSGVENIINELPPDCESKNKLFLGIYKGAQLVAILDLIAGYPNKETAFIGLFMVDRSLQSSGIGSGIINKLIEFLKSNGYKCCRLGVIEKNVPAINFWNKMGFEFTGEKYNHVKYNVLMMEKRF